MSEATFAAIRFQNGIPADTFEPLVAEIALQIRLNGQPYTITMQTPGQEAWLAAGLLFTEGIISTHADILALHTRQEANGTVQTVEVSLWPALLERKNVFNRRIASNASCGVCGKTDWCELAISQTVTSTFTLNIEAIPFLVQQMQDYQQLFDQTGGSHAAGLFDACGQVLTVQEDIGRHNAVDKAIGCLLATNKLADAAVLLVSGRVSYEIVAKCVQARIPFLLSVSAPSALAVEMCLKHGITLVAFCRGNRATVYTHPERIAQKELVGY